jgi:prevent-host-death family protein
MAWPGPFTAGAAARLAPPLEQFEMTIYDAEMDISVTDFRARCLDLIRKVEESGRSVTIKRRGKTVARLEPAASIEDGLRPWEQLRALGGEVYAEPDESVLEDEDFGAMR